MIRLLVKFKEKTIKEFALDRIDALSIGRNPTHHLVIDNYAVSGNHAAILKEGNRYILKDTNSKNGTFLNGLTVQQATLKTGISSPSASTRWFFWTVEDQDRDLNRAG
jgi:hypothetical protein